MIRRSTIFWLLLVAASGYAMFQVKYEVGQLEDELARVNHQIVADHEAMHVLSAEWSRLNQPSRLDELARRHLHLAPIATSQIGQVETLPRRSAAPSPAIAITKPAPAPEAQLATASPRGAR